MTILPVEDARFDVSFPIVVVGGGAAGLVAAISAAEAGASVLVLERDSVPSGSTGLSSGMIPAAGTLLQKEAGVEDSAASFSEDIQAKSKGRSNATIVKSVTEASGATINWMNALPDVTLKLVEGFLYPGHSVARMHAPPDRTGKSLIGMLNAAAERAGVDLLTDARVTHLFFDPGVPAKGVPVKGIRIVRPDGTKEDIGCDALILACNGYGGNAEMVANHIPEMASADYFGHPGNQGDAVLWGTALGGETQHMTAYQGHGSVAVPHGILITWAVMMEGGIQVNREGHRFANEHLGYSEQAVKVLSQPEGIAWNIIDDRLYALGMEFDDFRVAVEQGAVRRADTIAHLADLLGAPEDTLRHSLDQTHSQAQDTFGRDFSKTPPLVPPFYAIKVSGALFHTQGGLRVDANARMVLGDSGTPHPNLYAVGGAACGVSGPDVDGYLSGNGLLTAVTLGRLAGLDAAKRV